jgi:hypothetical protein
MRGNYFSKEGKETPQVVVIMRGNYFFLNKKTSPPT